MGCCRAEQQLLRDTKLLEAPTSVVQHTGEETGFEEENTNLGSYFDRELPELDRVCASSASQYEPRPEFNFETGASYTGQWWGNRRHGFGVQAWPDGATYEGEWRMNRAYGKGRFSHKTG